MKHWKIKICAPVVSLFMLAGCGGGGGGGSDSGAGPVADEADNRALSQNQNTSGQIASVGDVDWYTVDVQDSALISVKVSNNTARADVDLLMTVYEKDSSGNLVRLAADHATEGSALSSNVAINLHVDSAKTLFVSVRDLNDDDASSSEPYYITYDVAEADDGNSTFASAVVITPGDASTCQQDSIGTVGDVDIMTFNVATGAVYEISTNFSAFNSGTDVKLDIALYNGNGVLMRDVSDGVDNMLSLVESLPADNYFIMVKDKGQDNFDTSSSYTVCVNQIESNEVAEDDVKADAGSAGAGNDLNIEGSLDYASDADWSHFTTPNSATGLQILAITFDPTESNDCQVWFLVEVEDEAGNPLFSKQYSSEVLASTVNIKVENTGKHYLKVAPVEEQICVQDGKVGSPYSISMNIRDVNDADELGEGNNSIANANELDEVAGQQVTGLIGYMSDVDWYEVVVPADNTHARALEIYLNTDQATNVEYYVNVFLGDDIVKTFVSEENDPNPVSFKSSLLIPPTDGTQDRTYFIKVSDLRSDEGDDQESYRLKTQIVQVPSTAPVPDAADASTYSIVDPVYFSESTEQIAFNANDDDRVTQYVASTDQRVHRYNTDLFNVAVDEVNDLVVVNGDPLSPTSIAVTYPWASGFVDYDTDRDWFKLDLDEVYTAAGGTDSSWYVDVEIELYSSAPGSEVEYSWGLYHDHNKDLVVQDTRYIASNGDTSRDVERIYIKTPETGSNTGFWFNDSFVKGPFYFSVGDIVDDVAVKLDNDWDDQSAYFFRVKLTFYPGETSPE